MEVTDIKVEGQSARMHAIMSLSLFLDGLGSATVRKITQNLRMRINHEDIIDLNPDNNATIDKSFIRKYGILDLVLQSYWPVPVTMTHVTSAPYNKLRIEHYCDLKPIKWIQNDCSVQVKFNLLNFLDGKASELFQLPTEEDKENEDEYSFDLTSVRIQFNISCWQTEHSMEQERTIIRNINQNRTTDGNNIIREEALRIPKFITERIPRRVQSKENIRDRGTLNWQSINFTFEMYRHPIPTLLVTSLPVLFLSALAIAIYFEENSLASGISNVATIMIAFTTYLPFVRDKVIKTYRVTKIDWMLIVVLLINILTLSHILIEYLNPSYVFNWRKDPLAWVSISALILLALVILGSMIVHNFRWKRKYRKQFDCPANNEERRKYTETCRKLIKSYLEHYEDGYEAGFLDQNTELEFVDLRKLRDDPTSTNDNRRTQTTTTSEKQTLPTAQENLPPSLQYIYSPRHFAETETPYYYNQQQPSQPRNRYRAPLTIETSHRWQ